MHRRTLSAQGFKCSDVVVVSSLSSGFDEEDFVMLPSEFLVVIIDFAITTRLDGRKRMMAMATIFR